MRFVASLALAVLLLGPGAMADNVKDVLDIATFEGQNNGGVANVNIEQNPSGDPTGGGQFIIGVGAKKTGCTPDHGVILQDQDDFGNPQNCYYRQFSGPVHLPWYGVSDAADPSCYNNAACDAKTALFNAFAASAQYGDGGVTTDGRSIALLTQCASCISPIPATAEIPKGQYLTCARPPGARHSWDDHDVDAYWRLPGSLVLNPAYTIFRDESTLLSDCFIRPSWLYPQSKLLGDPLNLPPSSVADTVQMTHKFTGTATKCIASGCGMDHVTIYGFAHCDNTDASSHPWNEIVEKCSYRDRAERSSRPEPFG